MTVIRNVTLPWSKRIWYGLGGFVGNNIAFNLISMIGFVPANMYQTVPSAVTSLLATVIMCVLWLRWFYPTRKHESTQTGIVVSVLLNLLFFAAGALQGL